DIADIVDWTSHCSFTVGVRLEQAVLGDWQLDTQAFPASGADMDGAKLAVVDTLQHGLAGDAEGDGGSPYGYPPGGRVVGDEGADGVGEADPPGRAGGDLLAGDEPVVEPPVEGGGGDAELGCGLVHADHVTVGVVACSVRRGGDAVALADGGHVSGGECDSGGGAALLLAGHFGDHRVVVAGGQPADQLDGVFAGAIRRPGPGQVCYGFADHPAFPVQHEAGVTGLVIDGDDNVVQQGVEEFLAVTVGGRRRGPQCGQIGAEGEDPRALVRAELDGAGGLAAVQFGVSVAGGGERGFPLGFQAAGDQPVFRVDGPVAAFGSGRGVAGLLGLAAPLIERGVVPGLDLVRGVECGLQCERGEDL